MRKVRPGFLLAFTLTLIALVGAHGLMRPAVSAQVRPVYSRGALGLVQVLQRLQTTASLMHTGAHPDDEDTALIARVARGDHARVAYLALNRGEGGQNIIGLELFDALGVIRTEELLQARTLDGGDQFFTTAFDFGFTKTIDEAATKYGEERILGDMVRAIRLYRPLVLVARFSGTPADGHGQHQLAGKLTPIAFKAAADPARFPEHMKEGLRPWQVKKLYVGQGFRPNPQNEPTLRLETGVYDPLLGRTYAEIAMEGRSQHKSQEMGTVERRGSQISAMRLVERADARGGDAAGSAGAGAGAAGAKPGTASTGGAASASASGAASTPPPTESGVFEGLDTTIPGLAKLAGLPDGALKTELAAIQKSVATALKQVDVDAPANIVPALAEGLRVTRAARAALKSLQAPDLAKFDADSLLAHKEADFEDALVRASGLTVDALADRETAAPGESLRVTVQTYQPVATPSAKTAVVKLGAASVKVPAGWEATVATGPAEDTDTSPFARFFRETPTRSDAFSVKVAKDAPFTTPYWLATPRKGNVFEWEGVDAATKNLPFAPPVATAELAVEIGGVPITLKRPVEYRYADSIRGEIRRPFSIVPGLTVAFDSKLEIVPVADLGKPRRVAVRLQNQTLRNPEGTVTLKLPEGWKSEPAQAPFVLKARGEKTAVFFTVTPAPGTAAGAYQLSAEAVSGDQKYVTALRMIEYPHIQTHRLYDPAVAAVRVVDLKVAPVRVGYVMGSGDLVPDAIRRMGLDVTLLNEDQLSAGDLSRFDTIVVGVRASESRPEFVSNNGRLLQFARDGGTLIVQYQQTDYVSRNLAPLPAEMPTRVTDENAPITVLQPAHPVFNFPNRITDADWKDWVQERNLYAFSKFDPQYVPLLETLDPGEPVQRGGEVYLKLGKGHYIYTSYAWFRQLPAGVPGAYRLFANLLSLPKADPSSTNAAR
jgi:LmbE family N-acetylglucosaminyl deacetylase